MYITAVRQSRVSAGAKGCLRPKMAPKFLLVDHLGHIFSEGGHSETRQ